MSDAIEVLSRTRKVLNTNPVIKAHLDSYCFYLENEGRGKTEAREEVFDLVNELESEFEETLLALEQKEKLIKYCNELEANNKNAVSKALCWEFIGTCKVKQILGIKKEKGVSK